MKTHPDCFACFLRHALDAAKMTGADAKTRGRIMLKIARILPKLPLHMPPPVCAGIVTGVVRKMTKTNDLYAAI
jgi:uncharacterized protein with ATP-grasp and redox domains